MGKYIEPNITHVLRDGTVLKTMEGFVLPVTSETSAVYQIWADRAKRKLSEVKMQMNDKSANSRKEIVV